MLVHKIVAITPIPTSTMGKFSVVRLTTWRVIFDIRLRTQGATKPIKHLVASTARTALVNNNAYDAARHLSETNVTQGLPIRLLRDLRSQRTEPHRKTLQLSCA